MENDRGLSPTSGDNNHSISVGSQVKKGVLDATRCRRADSKSPLAARIPSFMPDPELILDVIPADMVVNQMMAAMAVHAYENGLYIYHAASSVGNPLHFYVAADESYKYFIEHPCIGNGRRRRACLADGRWQAWRDRRDITSVPNVT